MNPSDPNEPPLSEPPDIAGSRFTTRLALSLAGVAMIATGIHFAPLAFAADSKGEAPMMVPAKVTVAPVEQQTLADHRELIGRVDARETVEIRPRVSGHIDDVRFQAGTVVEKGDVLFVIDPRPYRAKVELAEAALERAKVGLGKAENESRRTAGLLANRAVSREEAETRSSRVAEARTEVQSAEAQLATAKLDLEYTEVRSPIRGKVSRALITPGNLVSGAPGFESLLATVVSTGDVYVYADVDEATALSFSRLQRDKQIGGNDGRVAVEMQVGDEKGFPHQGLIESSDNRVDPSTGTLVYRMVFPNPDESLVPGLFARVRLPVSPAAPTLLVSERSIGTNQSQKFVLTVDEENTVSYRTVRLGPVLNGKRVIRDGIGPHDRVIVNGLQRVTAGMIVDPAVAVN
ncbi:efflux RND transporter periplasmic adaptor subunit [Luteolibacter marinus]|uniref:efflux RND transporter periplasmic adaptor subunit n=1 Tax=Luteolibacter marinus TaxID=2776705 RepID=UPI001867721D|nr:efflux RND transporter periplasmic adaptor subunit [Luteolibacter marinus]